MGVIQWVIITVFVIAILVFVSVAVVSHNNVYPISGTYLINDTEPFILSKVIKVIDGDTLDIENGERIRFAIVDTPERGEEGWKEAKDYTTARCLGKDVVIDIDDSQERTYGRLVGLVYCGVEGHFMNLELLALQHAVVVPKFCKISEFREGILCQYGRE